MGEKCVEFRKKEAKTRRKGKTKGREKIGEEEIKNKRER